MSILGRATFEYKCRFCGLIFDGCHTGENIALGHLTAAILDQKEFGIQRAVDRLTSHNCGNGRTGLADLIGFRIG